MAIQPATTEPRWQRRKDARPAELLAAASACRSVLLVAPTGAGKTLAGFLPSLVALAADPRKRLHTLYISPLKALAVDIHRNLEAPIAEMGLALRAETRTGDTPAKPTRTGVFPGSTSDRVVPDRLRAE
jgi:ATP-dependent Lhr-like helicase